MVTRRVTYVLLLLMVLAAMLMAAPSAGAKRKCTPGYKPCLRRASDYDCYGGGGDGPKYVKGTVKVTGSDPYGLDADNDGVGCED